jgi:hypothetical protein
MKMEKMEKLRTDLQNVADQYGVKDWAFCGVDKQAKFVGLMQNKQTQGAHMLTIINVGRMWQWARESCRCLLNSYEKLP